MTGANFSVTYSVSEKDMVNLGRRRALKQFALPIMFTVLAGVGAAYRYRWDVATACLGGLVLLLLAPLVGITRTARTAYRSQDMGAPTTFQFTADGFEVRGSTAYWHNSWTDVQMWDKDGSLLTMALSKIVGVVIPTDAFTTDQVKQIMDSLFLSGLPTPGKWRRS